MACGRWCWEHSESGPRDESKQPSFRKVGGEEQEVERWRTVRCNVLTTDEEENGKEKKGKQREPKGKERKGNGKENEKSREGKETDEPSRSRENSICERLPPLPLVAVSAGVRRETGSRRKARGRRCNVNEESPIFSYRSSNLGFGLARETLGHRTTTYLRTRCCSLARLPFELVFLFRTKGWRRTVPALRPGNKIQHA